MYLQGDLDGTGVMSGDALQGEVQILHATPEQISQLQHAQHIQILQGDQVIQVPVPVSTLDQGSDNSPRQRKFDTADFYHLRSRQRNF